MAQLAWSLLLLAVTACAQNPLAVDAGPAPVDGSSDVDAAPELSGARIAVGMTPFDTTDPSSFSDTLDEIAARGAIVEFIQGAKWSSVCRPLGEFEDDYLGVAQQLAGVEERNMDLLYALDFTQSADRSQLNRPGDCDVPEEDFSFQNPSIRQALLAEVSYIANTWAPRYLAIGVEIDGYMHHSEAPELDALIQAFQEARDAVKAIRSDTVVFAYFQYEATAILGDEWASVARLMPYVDAAGFSSYPQSLQSQGLFADSSALTDSYYAAISDHVPADKPIIFAELGATVTSTGFYDPGPDPQGDQELFVNNFFGATEEMNIEVVTWMFYHDLDFTVGGVYDSDAALFFSGMGLKPDKGGPARDIGNRGAIDALFSHGR